MWHIDMKLCCPITRWSILSTSSTHQRSAHAVCGQLSTTMYSSVISSSRRSCAQRNRRAWSVQHVGCHPYTAIRYPCFATSLSTISSPVRTMVWCWVPCRQTSDAVPGENLSTDPVRRVTCCVEETVYQVKQRVLFHQKARNYWSDAIASCHHDPRALWSKINKLCGPPSAPQIQYTASDLASHFVGKVEKIKASTVDAETLYCLSSRLSQLQMLSSSWWSPPLSTAGSTLHRPGSSNVQPICWPQSLLRCAMPH